MRKYSKRTLAAGTVGALAVSGVAFAYWTTTGNGTSTASTKSGVEPVTVVQSSSVVDLVPGGAAQTLSGTFNNPNTTPVYVGGVQAAITVAPAGTGTCTAADYILVQPGAVNAQIPAGNAQGAWSGGSIQFDNKPTVNQDGCKGATVTLTYTVTSTTPTP